MNWNEVLDISELMFSRIDAGRVESVQREPVGIDAEDEHRKKIAKDFESIFIRQLLDTMKETIPDSDLEDSSSKQVESIYWSFLGDAVAEKGGFGLWKEIYKSMREQEGLVTDQAQIRKLDESL